MAIVVDYTPVGALGSLATQAGKNDAAQLSFLNALRQQEADRAERAQRQSETAQLLQYVLQQKSLVENARQFDLSRADQRTQFALSSGARSAAIRSSVEQANQTYSLQQAAQAYRDREQAFKFATTLTPGQKQAVGLQNYLTKAQIGLASKLQYHDLTTPTSEQKLGEFTAKEEIKSQFKTTTPATGRPMAPTGVIETPESKQAQYLLSSTDNRIRQLTDQLGMMYTYEPTETTKLQIQTKERELQTLNQQRDQLVKERTEILQTTRNEAEDLRRGYNDQQYNRLSSTSVQPPAGPVAQQQQTEQEQAEALQLSEELQRQFPDKTDEELAELLQVLMEARRRGR